MIKHRLRHIREALGAVYLTRFYIWGAPRMADGSSPFETQGAVRLGATRARGTQGFFHRVARSDERPELHNHPWDWAYALILWGGYMEERCEGMFGPIVRRRVWPGQVVRLGRNTYHRIELIDGRPSYSFFLAGPLCSAWGFIDKLTRKYVPARMLRGAK